MRVLRVLEVTMRDGNLSTPIPNLTIPPPRFRSDYEGWKLIYLTSTFSSFINTWF